MELISAVCFTWLVACVALIVVGVAQILYPELRRPA